MKEWKKFAWLAGIFLVAYFLPLGNPKVSNAVMEAVWSRPCSSPGPYPPSSLRPR